MSNFGRLRSYGHFLIPVHALVWTTSYGTSWRVMYSTWWLIVCFPSIKFCHLTHPPSYTESNFKISTLGRYLRNAGKVGRVSIHLAGVHCMTQLLLHVRKPLSLTLQWMCRLLIFVTVQRQFHKSVGGRSDSVEYLLILYVFSSQCLLGSWCHLHFQLQSMQIWFMCTVFVTVIQLMT